MYHTESLLELKTYLKDNYCYRTLKLTKNTTHKLGSAILKNIETTL